MDHRPSTLIIANRGPNDFVWNEHHWQARRVGGGLVSMLAPLARQPDVAWLCCVSEPPDAVLDREGLYTTAEDETDPEMHIIPVPLPARIYHAYYGQISNEVLWMLQHHLLGPDGLAALDQRRHLAWHEGYLEANRRLAAAVAALDGPLRACLIQDYHLYPLPALLRARRPPLPLLHFTHIPFPAPTLWQWLPAAWRTTIFDGLLGADVVGFQTTDDVANFLAGCAVLAGRVVDSERATVTAADGRTVQVRVFPASTDPEELAAIMATPAVASARARLAPAMTPLSIVRVDRLDPSKNQPLGLCAFERLLERRPDLCGRVRFLNFLVPSRTDLSVYRAYRDAVYAQIEAINERWRERCDGPPISIFYTNDREQALAALAECDVLLVNSRADGMNLVAKEWALVSRRPGVLVVSETSGVARELADAALSIAALDIEGTAVALSAALDLPLDERLARLARARERVQRWTGADWLAAQLAALRVGEPVS